MKRVMQAPNLAIASMWADTLREDGIEASVQREFLGGAMGELPPDQCLPEVWVRHDQQFERARALLELLQNLPQRQWQCPACGEAIEGGFEQCWQCGALMPVG